MRRLLILVAVLALGVAVGLALWPKRSEPPAESVAHAVPLPPPATKPAPAPPDGKAGAIGEGRLAAALPLLPVELPAAEPPPATPQHPHGERLITAQKDPRIVYEEALEEPVAAPAAASPKAAAAGERKPVLLAALAHLEIRPAAEPRPAWLESAVAMPEIRGRPMVALVIDDAGVDRKRTERAMRLPPLVTMSFLPYAQAVARQVEEARGRGHEVIVHVPMEPENASVDPGPQALRLGLSDDELLRRLDWNLSRFSGYVGINNHMGSKFTQSPEAMRKVLEVLKARGLLFLDSRTTPASVGGRLARGLGLPTLERDVFLDNVDSRDEIAARLEDVARIARRDGYAIAIGHPRDATLDVLERWTRAAEAEGLVLVPLSGVLRALIAAAARPGAHETAVGSGRIR